MFDNHWIASLIEKGQQVPVIESISVTQLPQLLRSLSAPVIFKGLVDQWPVVQAAKYSSQRFDEYLRQFKTSSPVTVYRAESQAQGRIFYNEDFSGFNFQVASLPLTQVLDLLREHLEAAGAPTFYVGSTLLERFLPEFREANDLPLNDYRPLVSLWLGNRSRVAAHYDFPDNLACCIAGQRQFVLFPPEQVSNLYIGPLDFTPSGQAISLVDFYQSDFDRFPKFADAIPHAQVANLEPGDALFIPSMWWHHVESLSAVNGLVNYWWRSSPAFMGNPADVLTHAMMSLKGLPKEQKQAWQALLDHYVFNDEDISAHVPAHLKGALGSIDEQQARKLRAQLLQRLNR